MSNFLRLRSDGFWSYNSVWDPAEAEANDAIRPKLANFTDGSTHAPSDFVEVGGSGFKLTGTGHIVPTSARLSASGEIKILSGGVATIASGGAIDIFGGGTVQSTGSLAWVSGATATFQSGSTCNQNSGSTWNLSGSLLVRGTLTIKAASGPGSLIVEAGTSFDIGTNTAHVVSGGALTWQSSSALIGASGATAVWGDTWTFNKDVHFGAASSIVSNAAATLAWAGVAEFSNVVTYTGDNGYQSLRTNTGPDNSIAVQLWKQDVLIVPDLTGDRAWTLDHPTSNRVVRCTVEWPSSSTNHSLELIDGATSLITVDSSSSSTDLCSIVLVYNGTKWFVESEKHKPRVWLATYGSDGDISVPAGDYDVVTIYHLTLDRTWTFDAPTDDEVRQVVIRWPAQAEATTLTLKTGSDTFGTMTATSAASGVNALAVYDGNKWYLAGRYSL